MRTACLLFVCFLFSVSASAQVVPATPGRAPLAPPKIGDTVQLDADALAFGARPLLEKSVPNVGEPDDERFENMCDLHPPFKVTVIGTFEETVVARHQDSNAKKSMFDCRNNGVILFSTAAWTSLRRAEEAVAQAKAAKESRREEVRRIISAAAAAKPAQK